MLFSHGLGALPESFRPLFESWVSDGFVVVGPTYPHTNGRVARNERDLVNQPADASFVLDSVIELASARDDPLSGLVDPERIAAVGHSMGGMTTVGLASTCCADERIDAGVVYAGDATGFRDDGFVRDAPPLLFIHGDADAVVSHESGLDAYEEATGPKAFMTLAAPITSGRSSTTRGPMALSSRRPRSRSCDGRSGTTMVRSRNYDAPRGSKWSASWTTSSRARL